jgi:hypothetical protein
MPASFVSRMLCSPERAVAFAGTGASDVIPGFHFLPQSNQRENIHQSGNSSSFPCVDDLSEIVMC